MSPFFAEKLSITDSNNIVIIVFKIFAGKMFAEQLAISQFSQDFFPVYISLYST
jgi:hypothetical protein